MDVGDVIGIVIAISGVILAWYKAPIEGRRLHGETSNFSADAALKYQELASKAAEQIAAMQKRMELLESQVEHMEMQLETAQANATKFQDWAKRLSHQVHSLGGVPVPLETETLK